MDLEIGKLYRHKKTQGIYRVLYVGTHSETEETLVIYQSQTDNRIWCRPITMFCDGRFERYYPNEVGQFKIVEVFNKHNQLVAMGTYIEIIDFVRDNITKDDRQLNFAAAEDILENRGFFLRKTTHELPIYHFDMKM